MTILYILISIIALAVIATLIGRKKRKKPSHLAIFAMLLVVLGIIFGSDRLIGYSFMGIGVVLAVIDIMKGKKA